MNKTRPYFSLSTNALKDMVRESEPNSPVLTDVAHELTFRSTDMAKHLAREIVNRQAGRIPPRATVQQAPKPSGESNASGSKPKARTPTEADKEAHASDDDTARAKQQLAALRATFTAESEYLARWGLSSLAPKALQEQVFEYWDKELRARGDAHPLGLGIEDLARDRRDLTEERRGDDRV